MRSTGIHLEYGKAEKFTTVDYADTSAYFTMLARSILLNSSYDWSSVSIFVSKAPSTDTLTMINLQVQAEPQEIAGIYATLNSELAGFGLRLAPFAPVVGTFDTAIIWNANIIHIASAAMAKL